MKRFRARSLQALPAREGRWVVLAEGIRTVITTAALSLLGSCTSCRSLQEHEAAYAKTNRFTPDRLPVLRAVLDDLLRRGLFQEAVPLESAPIRTIVIPGDHTAAAACIRGFGQNAREFGHTVRFAVNCHCREREWIRRLTAAAPERVVRFLLRGDSIGAIRNRLLLESAGEKVLSVDPGTLCEWRQPPGLRRGLCVTDGCPLEIRSHLSREAAQASAPVQPFDVLRVFGERLGPAIRWDDESVVSRIPLPERTAVVLAGFADSRWQTIAATQETLTSAPQWNTSCMALDARQPLVPFPPSGPNPERVCAWLMSNTQQRLAVRHLPWTVWREPAAAAPSQPAAPDENAALLAALQYLNPTTLANAAEWLQESGETAYVRNYGESLEHWPAVWECARSFTAEGT